MCLITRLASASTPPFLFGSVVERDLSETRMVFDARRGAPTAQYEGRMLTTDVESEDMDPNDLQRASAHPSKYVESIIGLDPRTSVCRNRRSSRREPAGWRFLSKRSGSDGIFRSSSMFLERLRFCRVAERRADFLPGYRGCIRLCHGAAWTITVVFSATTLLQV